jgi:general secretion pathway protein H
MTSPSNIRDAGFTLLEMIVVIAVMGLAMLLIAGYGQPKDQWLQTQSAARKVADAMRTARGQAIAQDQPVAFAMPVLPKGLKVAVQAPANSILFEPDGSASGGSVRLSDAGRAIIVTADWLTGRVQIDTVDAAPQNAP